MDKASREEFNEMKKLLFEIASNQKVMSNNIIRLEKTVETNIENSPRIALIDARVKRLEDDAKIVTENKTKFKWSILTSITIAVSSMVFTYLKG